jgi:hypothetical protein
LRWLSFGLCRLPADDEPVPSGKLKIDELIMKRYAIDEVNEAFTPPRRLRCAFCRLHLQLDL